jgi:predicted permease
MSSLLRNLISGVRDLIRKEQVEREMDEELRGYLDAAVSEKMRRGMSREVAMRAARIEMGGTESVKEQIRAAGWETRIESFLQDVRYGLRMLRKNPSFTSVAVLALALGIGANTALFSVVNAVLLRQLPFAHADRTVWITAVRPERSDAPFSIPDFLDYRDHTDSLDSLSAVGNWSANVTGRGDAERLNGVRVSANLFETLGASAAVGRTLEPEDDCPGAPRVAVMTYGLWQRRFGGDSSLVGQPLELNGASYTLVGILPPSFFFPIPEAELAVPLVPDADPWRLDRNTVNFLRLVGRTRQGVTSERAETEMNALARKLREQFPEPNARKIGVKLTPMRDQITSGYRRALWVLLGAVGFVLLIGCANLANLNLARAAERRREMSIRSALGATRWRVIKQLLLESALLATGGGMLGALLAPIGIRGLVALSPSSIPRTGEIGLDAPVLAFTVLVSLVAAIASGLAPALATSHGDLAQQLNEGARGSTEGRRGKALRTGLVVVEVALSLILLAGAGVLLKSFSKVQTVNTGFDPHGVLAVRLSLPKARYPHLAEVTRFYDALLPRVRTLPGASAVGVVQMLPLSGGVASIDFTIVGRAFSKEEVPEAQYRVVNPMYLKAMRISLLAGREFNESDTDRTPLVCHINETLAKRFWPKGDAVGAHVMLDDNDSKPREAEVVGIFHDVKDRGLDAAPSFDIYIPLRQTHEDAVVWLQNNQYWVLRTAGDPLALANAFREQVRSVDGDVAASNVRSMGQYLSLTIAPRRFNLQLLSVFALAALALAVAGIYGVISYSVNQRAHEIGVRMAMGARRSHVLRMVIADGIKPVLAGLALGILGVLGLSKALASLVYAVSASDPATVAGVTLLFGCVSLAALYLPARRAARLDPMVALRNE